VDGQVWVERLLRSNYEWAVLLPGFRDLLLGDSGALTVRDASSRGAVCPGSLPAMRDTGVRWVAIGVGRFSGQRAPLGTWGFSRWRMRN
jgi:hypothetical protein